MGTSGSLVGTLVFFNGTSGSITVTPPTGALGTPTLTWPDATGTLALAGIGATISSNGTTTSPTAAQINNSCPIYTVNATTATFNIPAASTIQASGGCMFISNPSVNSYTLTPNGTDNLVGPGHASANTSMTMPGGSLVLVTGDGTSDFASEAVSNLAANTWTGQQSTSVKSLTINNTTHFTPDGSQNNYALTLTTACTCVIDNPSVTPIAGTSGIIAITQFSSAKTVTWGTQYYAASGSIAVQPTTDVNGLNYISYYVADATHIIIQASVGNATH